MPDGPPTHVKPAPNPLVSNLSYMKLYVCRCMFDLRGFAHIFYEGEGDVSVMMRGLSVSPKPQIRTA